MSRSSHGRLRFGTRKFRRTIERDDFWCFVAASAARIIISNDSFAAAAARPKWRPLFFRQMQLPLVLRECSFFLLSIMRAIFCRYGGCSKQTRFPVIAERKYSMSVYFKVSPIFRVATTEQPLKVTCLEHVTVKRFRNLVGQTRRTSNVFPTFSA